MKKMSVKILLVSILFTLTACTYTAKPYSMKSGMVEELQADSSIALINKQKTGTSVIENSGVPGMKVDLYQVTGATIDLLKKELEKRGVKVDDSSEKRLELSVESLYMGNYFVAIGCTDTTRIKTSSGYSKTIKEHNTSGIGLPQACDFAITKIVANILNDKNIRIFIDPMLGGNTSSARKLSEIKNLYLNGLISEEEYGRKKVKILDEI